MSLNAFFPSTQQLSFPECTKSGLRSKSPRFFPSVLSIPSLSFLHYYILPPSRFLPSLPSLLHHQFFYPLSAMDVRWRKEEDGGGQRGEKGGEGMEGREAASSQCSLKGKLRHSQYPSHFHFNFRVLRRIHVGNDQLMAGGVGGWRRRDHRLPKPLENWREN